MITTIISIAKEFDELMDREGALVIGSAVGFVFGCIILYRFATVL